METNKKIEVQDLTPEERASLLAQLQEEARTESCKKRAAYESLRTEFMQNVEKRLSEVVDVVQDFKKWLIDESAAFLDTLKEYGKVKNSEQKGFTITEGDFKLEVSFNKVKGFDERANAAATRLIEYLERYIEKSDKGKEDPMYQLAMSLLERNKVGDFEYKSISKLYSMEDKFDDEYREIMELFRESDTVRTTATNFYFHKRDKNGFWVKIEPSFCRI